MKGKARLHWRQRQRYNDASDTALIEKKWRCNLFWSDSIVFNESGIASIIAALTLMLSVNGPYGYTPI